MYSTASNHPRRRQWHPTPVLLPGKSHGQRSLVGFSPWGCEESDMTERLHFHFSLSCIEEGNGNPLQCSCLENPRDGGSLVGCRLWGHTESDMTEVIQQQQQQQLTTLIVFGFCCAHLNFHFFFFLTLSIYHSYMWGPLINLRQFSTYQTLSEQTGYTYCCGRGLSLFFSFSLEESSLFILIYLLVCPRTSPPLSFPLCSAPLPLMTLTGLQYSHPYLTIYVLSNTL